MYKLITLLAFASFACGIQYDGLRDIQYDGLRVKFGWSDALADTDYFYKIPRTISDAEKGGWKRTERPPGALLELRLYCPPGRAVCPLFDTAGFVAGLQIALPVDEFESPAIKPEKRFVKWHAPAVEGEPARDYWTLTQYYVSEESLKAGAGPQVENGATLQDGGVWVAGLDGRLMRIPSTEAELNSTTFKKQNCIPNMGTHYYYNMTRDLNCEDFLPWFALTTQNELIGTGIQLFGKLAKQQPRDWFERPITFKQTDVLVITHAPDCMAEWGDSYGLIMLHIYYVDKPWEIRCRSGDSVKPAPAYDRLLLNGYRYASQVADEVKKIFSG